MEKLFVAAVLIVTVLLLIQLGLVWRMQKRVGKAVPDISALLGRSPVTGENVLVYFYNQRCHACRTMTPLVEEMHEQITNVLRINITEQPQLTREFGITATPTIAMIENKMVRFMRAGPLRRKQLEQLLNPLAPNA